MRKCLFLLLLLITVNANAGGQQTLVSPDGRILGTQVNPIYVSGGGAQAEDSTVIFNVKTEYGARGNGIELADGNTTAGDKTFTSLTASFTSADVGKVITIFGAGGTNIDLTTTIASVTSSTEVELAVVAVASVVDKVFRYGNDDTTAIQNAINAVYDSGNGVHAGEVFFPAGIYIVNGLFNKDNNSQIAVPIVATTAKGVTIKLRGATPTMFNNRTSEGSTIFGTRNGVLGGDSILGGGNGALTFVRLIIEDLQFRTVQDPYHSALNLEYLDQVSIKNVRIDTSYYIGETVAIQTHGASYALKMPTEGNGNTPMKVEALRVARFYNGIRITEHTQLEDSEFVYCVNAINFAPTDNYTIKVGYVSIERCVIALNFPDGPSQINVHDLDVEQFATGSHVVSPTGGTINDPNSYGEGIVSVTPYGIGAVSGIIKNGGRKISTVDRAHINGSIGGWRITNNVAIGDFMYSYYSSASSATSGAAIINGQNDGTATESTHRLGTFAFAGSLNTTNSVAIGAAISAFAAENFTASAAGTDMAFFTAPIGSTTRTEKMRLTSAGYLGIGITAPSGMLVVNPPAAQTIAAGGTVAHDSCGTAKLITAAGAVTTSTSATFTSPAAGNEGCCMDVINVGAENITLDQNADFLSNGGADVVLGANDTARVCSTGVSGHWYQIGATGNN